jgi:iron complex transport system permease protein
MRLGRQQFFSFWVGLGLIGLILIDLWPSQGNAIVFWQSETFLELRLPRVLSALIGGIALGWSGLMMQTLFRNPLAGPFLIGITPGGPLGVARTSYQRIFHRLN